MADGGGLIQPNTAAQQAQLAQLAMAVQGYGAMPAIQHSAYLTDALNQIRGQANNIKSPLALGSNLLAEALDRYQLGKANKAELAALQAASQGQASFYKNQAFGPDQTGAPGGVPAPAGGAPQSQPSAGIAAAQPPITPQAAGLAQAVDPRGEDAAVRAVWGEARGEGKRGEQAVAGVIKNRADLSGQSLADVVSAPHQFAGYSPAAMRLSPNSREYQTILANIDPVLKGAAPNPAGNADHFYAPRGMPGGRPPSWDNGSGQMIGNQDFLALGYGGKPPGAPPPPSGGGQSTASGAQAPPAPRPLQIATGPDPSVPSGGGNGPSGASPFGGAPAMVSPPGSQPSPAPQPGASPPAGGAGANGPPTGPFATPQERQQIQWGMSQPMGSAPWQWAIGKAQEIASRASSPLAPPKDMMWGQGGRAVPVPGTEFQTVASGPGGATQADPFGKLSATANPNSGPLGANQTFGADGSVVNRPVQQQPTFKIPGANGVFVNGPDGRPVKVADDQFTPKDLGDRLTKLQGSDQYKAADNATNMYSAAVQAAQRPGGVSDVELRDFAARQFSGGVARQFNVGALDNAAGPWARLKQFIPEILSGQRLTPQARQAILQAMHDDAIQAQTAFAGLAKSDEAFVNGQGMSLKTYLPPLTRDLPPIPGIEAIPKGDAVPQGMGATPDGWPPGVDPNSPAGQMAKGFMARGLRFNQQTGKWTP